VQQITLSQRETKDELKEDMDGLNDGLKAYMEAKMDGLNNGLKVDMECLKEGLTKLLQEILPNGDKVLDETRDDNKEMLIMIS